VVSSSGVAVCVDLCGSVTKDVVVCDRLIVGEINSAAVAVVTVFIDSVDCPAICAGVRVGFEAATVAVVLCCVVLTT